MAACQPNLVLVESVVQEQFAYYRKGGNFDISVFVVFCLLWSLLLPVNKEVKCIILF
jgi:hypothetical protein